MNKIIRSPHIISQLRPRYGDRARLMVPPYPLITMQMVHKDTRSAMNLFVIPK